MNKAYKRVIRVLQSIILIIMLIFFVCPSALATESSTAGRCVGIAAGHRHSVFLRSDGTVWTCGDNTCGQLGDGTATGADRLKPSQISGLTDVKDIAAGFDFSLALKTDGTVWAWGSNNHGQLGDGTTTDRHIPIQVSGLTNVADITAGGDNHALTLKTDGTVWAWGYNYTGVLGDGTRSQRLSPVQVSGLTGVKAVAASSEFSLALKTDGTVWAWGLNHYGQLGDGTHEQRLSPVQVSQLTGVTAIAAGYNHSVALKTDGTIWIWGANSEGQLGDNHNVPESSTPAKLLTFQSGNTDIKAAGHYCILLRGNGDVFGWGFNNNGQLGDGTKIIKYYPVQSELAGAIALSAGDEHALALKSDGTVWGWGENQNGQLGDGTTTMRLVPVQATTLLAAQSGQSTQNGQSGGLTLTAQAGNECIHLSWNGIGDSSVIGYNLYKGTSADALSRTPETDFAITGTSYDDQKIQSGATYYYVLKPVYQNGSEGTPSNKASATANSGGTIVLTLGSPMMTVNGISKEIDPGQGTVPVIVDQRTFIPIRAVIEELGGTVGWDETERRVTICLGSNTVELWIDSTAIRVNGEKRIMDVVPYVSSTNRTMLPVRFVTESLGLTVEWNSVNQSATIYSSSATADASKTGVEGKMGPGTDKASASWAGNWSTEWGDLTLHQTDNSVSGTYTYGGEVCSISGIVSGNSLTGTFEEGGYTGVFQFTMSADCQSFSGRWHYDNETEWKSWSGERA